MFIKSVRYCKVWPSLVCGLLTVKYGRMSRVKMGTMKTMTMNNDDKDDDKDNCNNCNDDEHQG